MYQITKSSENKDLKLVFDNGVRFQTRTEANEYYTNMYGNFDSILPPPEVKVCPDRSDLYILDFSTNPCGLKAHAAEQFISGLTKECVAYAAPRVGHAAEAIAYLCEQYGLKGVFFAPSSRQVSKHQAVVTAYDDCELRFVKIPAMKTLNCWIRDWSKKYDAEALPFGLSGVPEVTAGIVNICNNYTKIYGQPTEFYCAVSTGTMIRGLEIGWPKSKGVGIAVARNILNGEKGSSNVYSYHKKFYQDSEVLPPFPTTVSYDAKAYDAFIMDAEPGSVFLNVGSDQQIEDRLKFIKGWETINSSREWGDKSDFQRGY